MVILIFLSFISFTLCAFAIFSNRIWILNIYILLDVLLCSIAEYFYELCRILARRASQNTNSE